MSLDATRELAQMMGVDQLALLRANRDRPWTVERGVLAFASVQPGDVFRHPDAGELAFEVHSMGCRNSLMLGGLSDFTSFDQAGSSFDKAWQSVATQVAAEGGDTTTMQTAQNDFVDAFEQMTSSATGFGVKVDDALTYASKYTIAGRTVLGAVTHVQGLIAAAQGASTPAQEAAVFNMFTGTLVGAVVAAGAVSAGVGSLIVAGAGVVFDLLASSGLLGTAPSGTVVCQSGNSTMRASGTPKIQVGCAITMTGDVINIGASGWRRFPKAGGSVAGEADWYKAANTTWYGDQWGGWPDLRLIDSAFPVYHYMACNSVPSQLSSFNQAWSQAWTANAEYALNGVKSQEDAQVLLHAVRIWNRAHSASSYYDLSAATLPDWMQGDPTNIYHPTLGEIASGYTSIGGSLTSLSGGRGDTTPIPFYPAVLMKRVGELVSANDDENSMVNGNLRIYTGSPPPVYMVDPSGNIYSLLPDGTWKLVLTASQAAALKAAIAKAIAGGAGTGAGAAAPSSSSSSTSAGMSTGEKLAIGAGVILLGAGGLWLGLGRPSTLAGAEAAWSHLLRRVGL